MVSKYASMFHAGEWWFSIIDVVDVLVGGDRARKYWSDLKKKLGDEGYVELSEKIGQLKMVAPDGKQRLTDCANSETLFRVIQSIPSPKVEPLKRWLAKVGKERLDEIENPELAMGRMQDLYEKKGYPKEWIDKRLRGIAVRQDLTDEWKQRGASNSQEFAILTNEIMHGTFALKVDEYKQVKALARENLRDHMTDIELILTMLGEATTTKLHRDRDSIGMEPLKKDAKDGRAVKVLARGMTEYRPQPEEREPLAAGRMLVITACAPEVQRTTRATAQARNRLVLALATEIVAPHIAAGSPLAALLAELTHQGGRGAGGEPRTGAALLADWARHPGPAGQTGLGRKGDRAAGA